jgi:uncharacterized membrane protein YhiD involved in acid resistance
MEIPATLSLQILAGLGFLPPGNIALQKEQVKLNDSSQPIIQVLKLSGV